MSKTALAPAFKSFYPVSSKAITLERFNLQGIGTQSRASSILVNMVSISSQISVYPTDDSERPGCRNDVIEWNYKMLLHRKVAPQEPNILLIRENLRRIPAI